MDDETKQAVDERVRWIDSVVADATKRGAVAIKDAIDHLDPDHLPGLLFMLLSTRAHDVAQIKQAMFGAVNAEGDVTLH